MHCSGARWRGFDGDEGRVGRGRPSAMVSVPFSCSERWERGLGWAGPCPERSLGFSSFLSYLFPYFLFLFCFAQQLIFVKHKSSPSKCVAIFTTATKSLETNKIHRNFLEILNGEIGVVWLLFLIYLDILNILINTSSYFTIS